MTGKLSAIFMEATTCMAMQSSRLQMYTRQRCHVLVAQIFTSHWLQWLTLGNVENLLSPHLCRLPKVCRYFSPLIEYTVQQYGSMRRHRTNKIVYRYVQIIRKSYGNHLFSNRTKLWQNIHILDVMKEYNSNPIVVYTFPRRIVYHPM